MRVVGTTTKEKSKLTEAQKSLTAVVFLPG